MKKLAIFCALACLMVVGGSPAFAAIDFHVDSAPNTYGSPAWAPWWTQTKADVVAGTFTDMRTGTHPGTQVMDPYDEIVYSTGDLGKRLHWIYWLPGETVAGLDGLFEVKWTIDWGGDNWTYEGGGWAADGATVGWSQPTKWEDYAGGVIGSLGFAWWSTDNDALPLNTDGSPYNEVDQADIDALRQDVFAAQTFAQGQVRYRESVEADWEYTGLKVDVIHPSQGAAVPEPASLAIWGLLGVVCAGVAVVRRRRRAA